MKKIKSWLPTITVIVAFVGVFVASWLNNWGVLTTCFTKVTVAELPGKLAPLAFAAAVIERAVEILISPWRDEGASKLQKAVDVAKAKSANPPTAQDAADLKQPSDELDAYRGQTQRYAFTVSIALSSL